jgi:hypothetical protein
LSISTSEIIPCRPAAREKRLEEDPLTLCHDRYDPRIAVDGDDELSLMGISLFIGVCPFIRQTAFTNLSFQAVSILSNSHTRDMAM